MALAGCRQSSGDAPTARVGCKSPLCGQSSFTSPESRILNSESFPGSLHNSLRNRHKRILQILGFSRELDDFGAVIDEVLEEGGALGVVAVPLQRDGFRCHAHLAHERLL